MLNSQCFQLLKSSNSCLYSCWRDTPSPMEAIAVSFCLCGCGSRCIWQSGNRRLSVAHALAEAPPNLQGLLGADAADTVPDAPPEKQCACVVERVLRLAFSVEQPQQYCFEPPRKRRRGKQAPALGTLLARSMRSPTTDVCSHFDWKDRRKGYHELDRRYALDMQTSVRQVRDRSKQLWLTADRAVRNGWSILAKVRDQMYVRQGRTQASCRRQVTMRPLQSKMRPFSSLQTHALAMVCCAPGCWI